MTTPEPTRDVVVIGGGPAGSTAAAFLARDGCDVLLVERDEFPRFHIGESLLPANVPIFEELGVLEELWDTFVYKPGALFVFGDHPIEADFSQGDRGAFFAPTPYSFMVERAAFDTLLLRNASRAGAEVRQGEEVRELLQDEDRVCGIVTQGPGGRREIPARVVLDCSGNRALIANRIGERSANSLKRMAVFGHYRGACGHHRIRQGWFVGQVVHDGWVWMIPLSQDTVSIGVVLSVAAFREAQGSPREFLEKWMRSTPFLKRALPGDLVPHGETHILGNVGQTSKRLHGPGWLLAGDAAFFIDPLFSSGVYLAMHSGRRAAIAVKEAGGGRGARRTPYEAYEDELKRYEVTVSRAVETFYAASRSRIGTRLAVAANNRWSQPKLTTFLAGDFGRHGALVTLGSRIANALTKVA